MLTEQNFIEAATELQCLPAAIKAVAEVEAAGAGFLESGEPKILFERHIFSRLTQRKFDRTNPDISSRAPGGYKGGQAEHGRLNQAAVLDRTAALKSASWGKFQILGQNFQRAGFKTLQEFINATYHSEQQQLKAFVGFIKADKRLLKAIRNLDWQVFASVYNGPAYRNNRYDEKMAAAFKRLNR
jgi:hypothetical protein